MPQSSVPQFHLIRKLLPYTTVAALVALIYLAWVFYSRSSQNRELQRQAEQKSIEQARKIDEMYGSGHLKILLFYADPAVVAKGVFVQLCYGVANATTVSIDNGVEEIKPSISRCVSIVPGHSTTYTLSASDDKGHKANQSIDVQVR